MVPFSFVCLLGTAICMVIWPQGNRLLSFGMFLIGLLVLILFFIRVNYQIRHARPTLYLKPYI
jgi:hypothetical protein